MKPTRKTTSCFLAWFALVSCGSLDDDVAHKFFRASYLNDQDAMRALGWNRNLSHREVLEKFTGGDGSVACASPSGPCHYVYGLLQEAATTLPNGVAFPASSIMWEQLLAAHGRGMSSVLEFIFRGGCAMDSKYQCRCRASQPQHFQLLDLISRMRQVHQMRSAQWNSTHIRCSTARTNSMLFHRALCRRVYGDPYVHATNLWDARGMSGPCFLMVMRCIHTVLCIASSLCPASLICLSPIAASHRPSGHCRIL